MTKYETIWNEYGITIVGTLTFLTLLAMFFISVVLIRGGCKSQLNLREKGLLTELYWYIAENKSEHPVLYHGKDILQSILRGEFGVADRLLKYKNAVTILPTPKEEN